jgi:hypothetical protein
VVVRLFLTYRSRASRECPCRVNLDTTARSLRKITPGASQLVAVTGLLVKTLNFKVPLTSHEAEGIIRGITKRKRSFRHSQKLQRLRVSVPAPDERIQSERKQDPNQSPSGSFLCAWRQLRPSRASQCDHHRYLILLRAIGLGCDLLDDGDVHAFRGTDADLQRSTAQRPCASRPIAGETLKAGVLGTMEPGVRLSW